MLTFYGFASVPVMAGQVPGSNAPDHPFILTLIIPYSVKFCLCYSKKRRMNRLRLSKGQLARISEILGNISVAWFSAGTISPLFTPPQTVFDFLIRLIVSLIMASVFLFLSLTIIKRG